jgi:PAS domain S-box-containing protein
LSSGKSDNNERKKLGPTGRGAVEDHGGSVGGAGLADEEIQSILQLFVYNEFGVIMVTDAEGTIQRISPSVERALGYPPQDVLHKYAYDFIHDDDVNLARRTVSRVVNTGLRSPKRTIRARHKNGSWRVCEFVARRLQDGYALSFHDVTGHRGDDVVMRQSDEILRKAFRASTDSITISRLRDGKYIEVNDEFERITGYSRAEVVGKTSLELGLWNRTEDRSRLEETLARDGMAREFEADFNTRDGEVRHCIVSAEILELDGERCMLAAVRDLTDSKHKQEALEWLDERLRHERQNLAEKEATLRQIIGYLDEEKAAFRNELNAHVKSLLSPILSKLRGRGGRLNRGDIDLLESSLKRIVDADIDDVEENFSRLTAREMDICEAIKDGLSSKEIADKFSLSVNTIHKHRQVIRRKLQLNNKEINLAAFLRSR